MSLQAAVMIGLDVSRSLAAQGPAYGVRRVSDVSGLGAGTEALRGQEPRHVSWLSSSVAGEAPRGACCCVMSCVVQTCFQSRIEPDSVGRDGHDGPHVCHPGHANEGDPRAAASSPNTGSGDRRRTPPGRRCRPRPAGVLPSRSLRCVLFARPDCSSPLPRTARQRPGAHSARDSPAAPLGTGGCYRSTPPVPSRAVFRRSCQR